MKSLLLHANKFATTIISSSDKPLGIEPEQQKSKTEIMEQCVVVLFCVEEHDSEMQIDAIYTEINKTCREIGTKRILISPFVHLSKNIANPVKAKKLYKELLKKYSGTNFVVQSSHFGYHKSLLLDIKGHPGSFRYREF